MPAIDEYLVRAHRADLLRAACTRRPQPCAETRHPWFRRPRRTG